MLEIDYKNLETRVHDGTHTKITFKPEDEIKLCRGIENGKHVVQVIMPWGNIYKLGTYESEEATREAFQKYDSDLKKGYPLRINGGYSIEILYPQK